jgi:hypothetical protein
MPVVDHQDQDRQFVLHRGRELLPFIRKSPSPANTTTVLSGRTRLAPDAGRDPVAHGAGGRRELSAEGRRKGQKRWIQVAN